MPVETKLLATLQDIFQQMTINNSEDIACIYQRLRAVEAVSFEFYIFDIANIVAQAAKACATRISETRKAALVQEKNWKSGARQLWHYPMHVTIWMAVVQEWGKATLAQDSAEYKDIDGYLKWATHNTKTVALEIPYFRRLECHDKTKVRIIVCCQCQSPDSATYKVWRTMEAWILSPAIKGERLSDIAPRNAKERKLQEWLDKVKGKKTENLLAANTDDADSDNFSVDD